MYETITLKEFIKQLQSQVELNPELLDYKVETVGATSNNKLYVGIKDKNNDRINVYIKLR